MEEILNKLFELAKPYLAVRQNQIHTELSYQFARQLLDHEGGREEIVLPAIILHDVGWSAVPVELQVKAFHPINSDKQINRIHEVEGAKIAKNILGQVGINEKDCDEISRIIESHDSGLSPITLEEKLVKDADKLWRFNPTGFAIDAERFSIEPENYWELLEGFRQQWFFTNYARELAGKELISVKEIGLKIVMESRKKEG
ncbi:MAG: HD domain-containing protein [Clostridia bacterium]|nr:HD domain-containing protein [Clostridia bacterium]